MGKTDDVSQLENEMTQLKDQMDKVADKQHYMWSRERAARRSRYLYFLLLFVEKVLLLLHID